MDDLDVYEAIWNSWCGEDIFYFALHSHASCGVWWFCLQEMASDSMKQLREQLTKEAIRDAMVAQTDGSGGSKCDLLRCPECSKNNCSYTQVGNINIVPCFVGADLCLCLDFVCTSGSNFMLG